LKNDAANGDVGGLMMSDTVHENATVFAAAPVVAGAAENAAHDAPPTASKLARMAKSRPGKRYMYGR